MNVTSRILGEAMTSWQRRIYKELLATQDNPIMNRGAILKAVDSAVKAGRRFQEAEPYIIRYPSSVYGYSKDVIKDRWPEAEATIAKDPRWSVFYARDVIKGRWLEVEEGIAKSAHRDVYLKVFPDAKEDWILAEWIDWLDT